LRISETEERICGHASEECFYFVSGLLQSRYTVTVYNNSKGHTAIIIVFTASAM